MADLYLVQWEHVPVEDIARGDVLILPNGRRVTVEQVDIYDQGTFVVRWWRPADRGEPEGVGDEYNGRFLGSCEPYRAGHPVKVDRADATGRERGGTSRDKSRDAA